VTRRSWAIAVLLTAVAVGVAGAILAAAGAPEPTPTMGEEKYADVSREDMEKWMQSIGYTE
jgi:hypothetical protein